ncbi:MAG: DUF4862 family protein [Gammaproteobacteria bacterium]|nr:DUF4862 family protein [Gammaproteobacteria bacterium]
MKYILGAYSTAPVTAEWNPELQAQYFAQLKTLPNLQGLEHPFAGSLHPYDEQWFLHNIDPQWDFVFTCIPGVMDHIGRDPEFGLAADDERGRQAALEFCEQARQAVLQLNRHVGRQAVKFVQLHSSPNRAKASSSSARALQASLETLHSRDWDGAGLLIEHCDTYIEGQAPAKGFLTIEEEIAALTAANASTGGSMGICVNWGRSALETRNTQGPLDHIAKARSADLLRGLMFSGASPADSPYGVWKDSHMPPAQAFGIKHFASDSLLTADEMRKCLHASDYKNLDYLGVKIAVRPAESGVAERVAFSRDALAILDQLST